MPPIWAQLRPTWAQFRANLGSCWLSWARSSILAKMQFLKVKIRFSWSRGVPKTTKNGSFRPTLPDLGPTWTHLAKHGPSWGQLGAIWAGLGQLGANLGSIKVHLGGNLGLFLDRIWGQCGFNLAPTAVQQTAESAVRNHWSKGLFETAPGQTHQRTCPTNCSSRAATVERLIIIISRSTTYSSPDDSFERCSELGCGWVPLRCGAAAHEIT